MPYIASGPSFVCCSLIWALTTVASRAEAPLPLERDLVLHLRMDQSLEDASGRSNHATAVGTPSFVPGKIGPGALEFRSLRDGSSFNYASLASPVDLQFGSRDPFSLSFWIRFTRWQGDPPFFSNKNWESGGNEGWVVATGADGRLQWNFGDGDFAGRTRLDYDGPPGGLSDGQWHHVVVAVDRPTEVRTYLDGREVDRRAWPSDLGSLDAGRGLTVNIGQDGRGTYTDGQAVGIEDGAIDDLAVWRRAITEAEAVTIHARGLEGRPVVEPILANPPTLRLERTGEEWSISWDPTATGYVLEATTVLPATAWQRLERPAGGTYRFRPTEAAAYFRLVRP